MNEITELLDRALLTPLGLKIKSPNRIALRTFILREISKESRYAGLSCLFSPTDPTELYVTLEKPSEQKA